MFEYKVVLFTNFVSDVKSTCFIRVIVKHEWKVPT